MSLNPTIQRALQNLKEEQTKTAIIDGYKAYSERDQTQTTFEYKGVVVPTNFTLNSFVQILSHVHKMPLNQIKNTIINYVNSLKL